MGLFRQMKDMKSMVEDAPEMIRGARELGAQAQAMAAAQQAASQQAVQHATAAPAPLAGSTATAAPGPGEAIAGVSLELYAEICRGLAAYDYDQSKAVLVASGKGVSPDSWQTALDGWNARIQQDPTVAQRFNQLYTGR